MNDPLSVYLMSRARRIKEITEEALKEASRKDTCWPGCAALWRRKNPAWGHCVMYALYINEYFDGEIMFMKALLPNGTTVPHYINLIDGEEIDASFSQFEEGTKFVKMHIVSREHVLSLPDREKERYEIFKQRVYK